MASAFAGLSYANRDPSNSKYLVVDRDNINRRPNRDGLPMTRTVRNVYSAASASPIQSGEVVGETLIFQAAAAGQSYQLPDAYFVLRQTQGIHGGSIASSYNLTVTLQTRIENVSAGTVTLTAGTGLNLYPDNSGVTGPLVIPAETVCYLEWSIRDSSPLTPSIDVRILNSSNANTGILSVQAGNNIFVDNTDPLNPIVRWIDYNSQSTQSYTPNYTEADIQAGINMLDTNYGGGFLKVATEIGGTRTWEISSPILIINDDNLEIDFNGMTLENQDPSNPTLVIQTSELVKIKNANFTFSGNPDLDNYHVLLNGVNRVYFENCQFQRTGVVVGNTGDNDVFNVTFDRCFFRVAESHGFFADNDVGESVGNVNFNNCNFTSISASTPLSPNPPIAEMLLLDEWTNGMALAPGQVVTNGGNVYRVLTVVGVAANPGPAGVTPNVDITDGAGNTYAYQGNASYAGIYVQNLNNAGGQIVSNIEVRDCTFSSFVGVGGWCENLSVVDCTFNGCAYGFRSPSLGRTATTFWEGDNVTFSNNTFDECWAAIYVRNDNTQAQTTNVIYRGVEFSNNKINRVGDFAYSGITPSAILILNDGNNADIAVNISNNQLYDCVDGIYVEMTDCVNDSTVSNCVIRGNIINVDDGGVVPTTAISFINTSGFNLYDGRLIVTDNIVATGGGLNANNPAAVLNRIIYANNATV